MLCIAVKLFYNAYICSIRDSNFTNEDMKKLLTVLCFIPILLWANKPPTTLQLNRDWQFTQTDKDDWHPATVPGSVQRDLIGLEILPNPYFGTNEDSVQ